MADKTFEALKIKLELDIKESLKKLRDFQKQAVKGNKSVFEIKDVKKTIKDLANAKSLLAFTNAEIKKQNKALLSANSAHRKFSSATEKSSKSTNRFNKNLYYSARSVGRLALFMSGAFVSAIQSINDAFEDFQEGFKELLQFRQLEGRFKHFADVIDRGSLGIIRRHDRLRHAMTSTSVGITEKQLYQMTKLSSATAKAQGKDPGKVLETFISAVVKGRMPENLMKDLGGLGVTIQTAIKEHGNKLNFAQKQQLILNIMTRDYKKTLEQLGDVDIKSPFEELWGITNKIQDSVKGLATTLGGMGKFLLAVLAPIGGGLATMAFGGPIAGTIGVIVGGILSASLAAFGVQILKQFVPKNDPGEGDDTKTLAKNIQAKLNWFMDLFGVGTLFAGGREKTTFSVSKETKDLYKTLYGKQWKSKLEEEAVTAAKYGSTVGDFSDGFASGFGDAWKWTKTWRDGVVGTSREILNSIGTKEKGGAAGEFGYIFGSLFSTMATAVITTLPVIAAAAKAFHVAVTMSPVGDYLDQRQKRDILEKDIKHTEGLLKNATTPPQKEILQEHLKNQQLELKKVQDDLSETHENAIMLGLLSNPITAPAATAGKAARAFGPEAIEYSSKKIDKLVDKMDKLVDILINYPSIMYR